MDFTPDLSGFYSIGLHGQDILDRVLGGGLPTGSLVVVEGEPGTGKRTLAGRFSFGLCEQSHSVTHLSTEYSLLGFLGHMRSLSYDITKSLLRRELLFLHGSIPTNDQSRELQLLSQLTAAQQMWTNNVVMLDRFSDVLLYDSTVKQLVEDTSQQQAIKNIIKFFRRIMATGTTIVLMISPSGLPDRILDQFRAVADVLLQLAVANGSRYPTRTLSVRRFPGNRRQIGNDIRFFIRPGSGIVIDNSSVV